jgi:hypothetical protein
VHGLFVCAANEVTNNHNLKGTIFMVMPSTTITRLDLSSTFTEFNLEMSRRGFIGPQVLRPRMVGIQAADVGKIPIASLLQIHDDARASGSGYHRGDFKFDKFSYSTNEHGWEEPLDDRNIKIYTDIFDAESIASSRAQDFVMRNYEIAVKNTIIDSSVFDSTSAYASGHGGTYAAGASGGLTTTGRWTAKATCIPIDDIEFARRMIITNGGVEPNAVIMSRNSFWNAANSTQVIDRLKYAGIDDPKQVTLNAMAAIWQVKHVLVAGGIYASNNEGQAFTGAFVYADSTVMLARVAETDDPREPCIGRTFMWSDDGPGAPGTAEEIAVLVEEYREENRRGSVIRARNDRDIVLMYPAAGCLITNTSA